MYFNTRWINVKNKIKTWWKCNEMPIYSLFYNIYSLMKVAMNDKNFQLLRYIITRNISRITWDFPWWRHMTYITVTLFHTQLHDKYLYMRLLSVTYYIPTTDIWNIIFIYGHAVLLWLLRNSFPHIFFIKKSKSSFYNVMDINWG